MSLKKTWLFLLALLLLGGYYYVGEVKLAEKKQAAEQTAQQLFQVNADAIQSITLTRGQETITLKKEGAGWNVTQPVAAAADAATVESLIRQFTEATRAKTIAASAADSAEFGLAQPAFTLAMQPSDGTAAFTLHVGQETPTASGYYVSVGEAAAVLTIAAEVKAGLDKTLYDLRDKTVLHFDPAQLTKAIFTYPNQPTAQIETVELTQQNGVWQITAPQALKADSRIVNDLFSTLKNAMIQEFTSETAENLAQYGLAQPPQTLTLFSGDTHTPQMLRLGKSDEAKKGVYAQQSATGNVFLLPDFLVKQFPQSLRDLRDKSLFAFANAEIQKIALTADGQSIVLERGDAADDWKITQPQALPADAADVTTLLSEANLLRVRDFVTDDARDLSQYGFTSPQFSLSVWKNTADAPQTLLIGQTTPDQAGLYAKLENQPDVVILAADALTRIPKTLFELRDRKVLHIEQAAIQKIALQYAETSLELRQDGDSWTSSAPEKRTLAGYKVNNLLYDVAALEFDEEFAAPAALHVYGLNVPLLTMTLWGDGAEPVASVLIGKAAGAARVYAKIADGGTVYAIPAAFLDELPHTLDALSE